MYMCIYIYIYICIRIHTYMCTSLSLSIYTYIKREIERDREREIIQVTYHGAEEAADRLLRAVEATAQGDVTSAQNALS